MEMKAIIFDMDGTLVDSLMVWDVLWASMGEKFLSDKTFRPSEDDDKKVRTLTLKDAMTLIHNNYNLGKSGDDLLECANQIIIDFYSHSVTLKPGAKEFLEHCKNNGVKMCIASATAPELLNIALNHCNVDKYFLKVFSCGEIGKGKDQPDIFLLAQEFLGESISDTWVAEDSLVAIETATKIGMPTVGVYDAFNDGRERRKEIATEYIAPGQSLLSLIK